MPNPRNNLKDLFDATQSICSISTCGDCNICDKINKTQTKAIDKQKLSQEIATAISEEQFLVYYQPKYSLQDESLIGAEALVRWQHPEYGLLEPAQFLSLAAEQGLMDRLDYYVWSKAAKQLHAWHAEGHTNLQLSLNISQAAFEAYDLVEVFKDLLKCYGFNGEHLHLEITEVLYQAHPDKVQQTMTALRRNGFVIELDDFGTGTSSLTLLSQLPLDVLKLDRAFVHQEAAKPYDISLLNDVISIAHRLDMSVVAEGVENREQMKRLRVMAYEYVQGFFFAKPMPPEEFASILHMQRVHRPRLLSSFFPQGKAHRILVVDESVNYANLIRKDFGDYYEILYVATAKAALELLSSDEHSISAIILSMTLPANGADTIIKQVRQQPGTWHIPIVATIPNGNVADKYPLLHEADDFLCKAHPITDLHKRIDALLDMLAFDERERILREAASRDFMTGLYNRRGLQAALASLRKDDFPLALCLFDLDKLKQVNDTHGHQAGDRFIEAFADILRHNTRLDDIQCRYGGDEFILVLKHVETEEIARKITEKIIHAFSQVQLEDDIRPSASVGIVLCSGDKRPNAHFIEKADKAMYKAKALQRGSCYVWHGDLV